MKLSMASIIASDIIVADATCSAGRSDGEIRPCCRTIESVAYDDIIRGGCQRVGLIGIDIAIGCVHSCSTHESKQGSGQV